MVPQTAPPPLPHAAFALRLHWRRKRRDVRRHLTRSSKRPMHPVERCEDRVMPGTLFGSAIDPLAGALGLIWNADRDPGVGAATACRTVRVRPPQRGTGSFLRPIHTSLRDPVGCRPTRLSKRCQPECLARLRPRPGKLLPSQTVDTSFGSQGNAAKPSRPAPDFGSPMPANPAGHDDGGGGGGGDGTGQQGSGGGGGKFRFGRSSQFRSIQRRRRRRRGGHPFRRLSQSFQQSRQRRRRQGSWRRRCGRCLQYRFAEWSGGQQRGGRAIRIQLEDVRLNCGSCSRPLAASAADGRPARRRLLDFLQPQPTTIRSHRHSLRSDDHPEWRKSTARVQGISIPTRSS